MSIPSATHFAQLFPKVDSVATIVSHSFGAFWLHLFERWIYAGFTKMYRNWYSYAHWIKSILP